MSYLNPDQIAVLKDVISDSVRASALLGIEEEKVKQFIANSRYFAEQNLPLLSDSPYILVLQTNITATSEMIDPALIIENLNNGKNVFVVDENLYLIKTAEDEASFNRCLGLSKEWKSLTVYVENNAFMECLLGKGNSAFVGESLEQLTVEKFSRPFNEFEKILDDQLREMVTNEPLISCWNDKPKRILAVMGKAGTETIFHRLLIWWLKRFITDSLDVYGETVGLGQFKTDITVVTQTGSHVIEVKWLGKNENNDSYGVERIEEGLEQVKIYLNGYNFVDGYLVLYDGRSYAEHLSDRAYDKTARHLSCHEPYFLFLDSETPSKKASRITRERRKK